MDDPGFGPNEWLVEEMYEQYLADPSSVDAAWHEFFSTRPCAVLGVRLAAVRVRRDGFEYGYSVTQRQLVESAFG